MRGEAKSSGPSSTDEIWAFSVEPQGLPATVFKKRLAIWPTSPHVSGAVGFHHRHWQDTSPRAASPYLSIDIRPSDTERVCAGRSRVQARPRHA